MDDKRREEIRKIVDHFNGKVVTNNVIEEFCRLNKFEPITPGLLKDYTFQVDVDNLVDKMLPLFLVELAKLRNVPEFAPAKERAEIKENNDEVRVNITKIMEDNAMPYSVIDVVSGDLGNFVGGMISSGGQTALNKATGVLVHLARAKFGGEFNMQNARDYAKEVFDKEDERREETKEETK